MNLKILPDPAPSTEPLAKASLEEEPSLEELSPKGSPLATSRNGHISWSFLGLARGFRRARCAAVLKTAVSQTAAAAAAMAAAGEVPGKAGGTLETAAGRQLAGAPLQTQTGTPEKQTSLARFFSRPDSISSAAQQDSTNSAARVTALVAVEPEGPQTPQPKRKLTLVEQAHEQPVRVQKPDTRPVHKRGGRPKKTEDSKKSSYTVLTGVQRLYIIQVWGQKMKAGASTRTARQQIASILSCSASAVKTTVKNREYWIQWGQDRSLEASTSPNKARRRGDNRSVLKLGTTSRRPGKRGYLGKNFGADRWSSKCSCGVRWRQSRATSWAMAISTHISSGC